MQDSIMAPDKAAFAIAAYNAARAEIVERLKIREDLVKVYLIACLSFAGGSFATGDAASGYYLSLVPPLVSLPVSIIVRQHRTAVEALARYLRLELTKVTDAFQVPTWDVYSKSEKQNEAEKTAWTNAGNFFGIHFVTICSVGLAWWRAAFKFLVADEFVGWSLGAATLFAVLAICTTIDSQRNREKHQAEYEQRAKKKDPAG